MNNVFIPSTIQWWYITFKCRWQKVKQLYTPQNDNKTLSSRFRFSTSRQTLTLIPDTFFSALLNGRISSLRDEKGAIFIDRDPKIFSIILNYLRTREIDLKGIDIRTLRHEAEYYNIAPLVKRLMLCEELTQSTCGDVLFYGSLPAPCKTLQSYTVNSPLKKTIFQIFPCTIQRQTRSQLHY